MQYNAIFIVHIDMGHLDPRLYLFDCCFSLAHPHLLATERNVGLNGMKRDDEERFPVTVKRPEETFLYEFPLGTKIDKS